MRTATDEDVAAVASRIGRRPRGVLGVVRRCRSGEPQVIVSAPVRGEEIFPTLFWLTCPALQRAVGTLEAAGWVTRLTERARDDSAFGEELSAAHARAAELRQRIADERALKRLAKSHPAKYDVIVQSGVGGIRDWRGVKCLHAHLADYLALGRNPVGAVTLELLRAKGSDPASCPV